MKVLSSMVSTYAFLESFVFLSLYDDHLSSASEWESQTLVDTLFYQTSLFWFSLFTFSLTFFNLTYPLSLGRCFPTVSASSWRVSGKGEYHSAVSIFNCISIPQGWKLSSSILWIPLPRLAVVVTLAAHLGDQREPACICIVLVWMRRWWWLWLRWE